MGREHKRHINKYGFTRLAEACENGDLDAVKEWLEKDHEQLEICEFAGNSPLQIASLNGYPDIVKFLLDSGCNKDCANIDNDTPLIDAAENGHSDVVQVLITAGVDPLHQNRKGQQALDVITDQTEDGTEIRELLKKAIEEWQQKGVSTLAHAEVEEERGDRLGPKQVLHFMARTSENLLKLVANNDRKGVIEFLNARVPVDNHIVAAAAKTGDLYVLNLLLADMNPRKAKSKAEKPMLAVLGTSHFEVVKTLTELEQFDPLWRSRANGMTWYEHAESRSGPHWKQERELLFRLYTQAQSNSRLGGSSPISDFKNSIRRQKSPVPSKGSDMDLDDGDSPDVARIKRRLMSRKDMRAATTRRSPSTDSSRSASSPEAVPKPNENEDSKHTRRKTGRPRTKSFSGQPSELKMKRVRDTRDTIALFDSSHEAGNKSRNPSTSSNSRPAAESISALKKTSNNNEDTIMIDAKAEEEKRAENAKREAEELKRAEDARREAEELVRREEAEKAARALAELQRRVKERNEKLETFPSALRHAIRVQGIGPTNLVKFLAQRFLPLQAVHGVALGLEGPARDVPWMLSYQAAGLLRGHAGDELLGLVPLEDLPTKSTLFSELERHPVSLEQRKAVQTALGSTSLADQMPDPATTKPSVFRARIVQETNKFLALQPLAWIKVRDFLTVKADLQISHPDAYPHLEHLPPLQFAFDARLGTGSFDKPCKQIRSPTDGPAPSPAPVPDVTDSSLPASARPLHTLLDDELRLKVGHGLKECDGRVVGLFMGMIKKSTKVEVVEE